MAEDTQNASESQLDALAWALKFMQDHERKLLNRAKQIIKRQRKDRQYGIIRQAYIQES